MLKYLPTKSPTLRNKIINSIIGHLKTQTSYIPQLTGEIVIIDHEIEPACPEGITFIFPKGAIILPRDWLPEFEFSETNIKLLNPPRPLLLFPDLIYRIDPDNHITGAGMMARESADHFNRFYST